MLETYFHRQPPRWTHQTPLYRPVKRIKVDAVPGTDMPRIVCVVNFSSVEGCALALGFNVQTLGAISESELVVYDCTANA